MFSKHGVGTFTRPSLKSTSDDDDDDFIHHGFKGVKQDLHWLEINACAGE